MNLFSEGDEPPEVRTPLTPPTLRTVEAHPSRWGQETQEQKVRPFFKSYSERTSLPAVHGDLSTRSRPEELLSSVGLGGKYGNSAHHVIMLSQCCQFFCPWQILNSCLKATEELAVEPVLYWHLSPGKSVDDLMWTEVNGRQSILSQQP